MKTLLESRFFDADAGVGNFDFDFVRSRIQRFNDDAAIRRGKFDRVLDQVPKDLLQACRIGIDVGLLCAQTKFHVLIFCFDFFAANFISALQDFMHARDLESELQFPFCDARDVEQVVDQTRFQFHVSTDHFQRVARLGRIRIGCLQFAHHRDDRRKRVSQFV